MAGIRGPAEPTTSRKPDRPVLPLYYRIFKTLERRIQEQRYRAGDRLPSEDALCREFRASRMTIRQALSRLEERRLVTRRRGSGTFAAGCPPAWEIRTITLHGVLEDLFAQVEAARVSSVSIEERVPPPDVIALLGMTREEPVCVIRRIRLLRGQPFALTVNFVSRAVGRRIRPGDLKRMPLLQVFEQRLGVRFTRAEQTVEARLADEDVAAALEGNFGDPILYVQRLMFAGGRHPVEVVRSYYRADMYRYQIHLVRRSRGPFRWATPVGSR